MGSAANKGRHAMKECRALFAICSLFFFFGCATTQKDWISIPEMGMNTNDYFEAQFRPIKTGHRFFDAFELVVTNKTGENLEIDWEKTHYLYNGRDKGGFVFNGFTAGKTTSDIIAARDKLSKIICPSELITWAPLRERRAQGEHLGCGIIGCWSDSVSP